MKDRYIVNLTLRDGSSCTNGCWFTDEKLFKHFVMHTYISKEITAESKEELELKIDLIKRYNSIESIAYEKV